MANLQLKCPCCGGTLQFDNKSQEVVCPYCDSHFSTEDLNNYNADLESDKQEDTSWDESSVQAYTNQEMAGMKIYSCDSCGGEIIVDETTSSTICPYCGNNLVVSKELSGDLKPNVVIPFKNDKQAVQDNLTKFFKKKPLLPGSFKKENTIQEIKPLYVPFWLFDADVDGKVRFKGEVVRCYSDAYYNYREVKYYSIIREGRIAFDHVPVDGSKKMEDKLMESIEPYDFSEAKEFNVAYLAGFAADRYDVDKEETFGRATERFRDGTISAFRSDISGYDNVRLEDSNIQLSNTKTLYALYPVWILNTKWRDKDYRFAVNGQTGKIAGDLPVSAGKFLMFFMIFLLGLTGLGAGIGAACGEGAWLYGLIFGAILGLIVALIVTLCMRRANKNVQFQYGASSYVRSGSFAITGRNSIFLYKKVDKTKKQTNNR